MITARSSALECASIFEFLLAEGEISKEPYLETRNTYDQISRILYSMIKNLNVAA